MTEKTCSHCNLKKSILMFDFVSEKEKIKYPNHCMTCIYEISQPIHDRHRNTHNPSKRIKIKCK